MNKVFQYRNSFNHLNKIGSFNYNWFYPLIMQNQYDVLLKALNELIEINYNRIENYKKAEQNMDGGDLKNLFHGMLNESEHFATLLTEHVVKFGGEPAKSSTLIGKAHQIWVDFKASIIANNRELILNASEFGDKDTLEAYEAVLVLDKVQASPDLTQLLMSQMSSIAESLKIIQSLKQSEHDGNAEQEVLENRLPV